MSKSFREDLTGKRFGRLTVLEFVPNDKVCSFWKCKCDCGNVVIVGIGELKKGSTSSCGCGRYRHHLSRERIYTIWRKMKDRCTNPKHNNYKYYGAKGIKICDEWLNDFISFKTWAFNNGYDDTLSIDRINVNGNYEPSNCRWISIKEQQWNKHKTIYVDYENGRLNLLEVSKKTGISLNTLHSRWQRGDRGQRLSRPVKTK